MQVTKLLCADKQTLTKVLYNSDIPNRSLAILELWIGDFESLRFVRFVGLWLSSEVEIKMYDS